MPDFSLRSVLMIDLDGPRTRTVGVQVMGWWKGVSLPMRIWGVEDPISVAVLCSAMHADSARYNQTIKANHCKSWRARDQWSAKDHLDTFKFAGIANAKSELRLDVIYQQECFTRQKNKWFRYISDQNRTRVLWKVIVKEFMFAQINTILFSTALKKTWVNCWRVTDASLQQSGT